MAWVVIVSHEETVPGPLNLRTELMKKASDCSTNHDAHNFDSATLLDSGVHSVLHLQSPRFDALFHHFDEAFLL
jgi:hypothetical protein